MQYMENLSDRQAADAVRDCLAWKYVLALDLDDPGFDSTVLCEFRQRLVQGSAETLLLDRLLDRLREKDLIRERGRQRTDSTHLVAALRELTRLELLGETLRAALNELAQHAPKWLRSVVESHWLAYYGPRVEERRLPNTKNGRATYARTVGVDGFKILDEIDRREELAALRELPAVAVLRTVWEQHYEREALQAPKLIDRRGRSPKDHVESPYEIEARYRRKRDTKWAGYMVHMTEPCDEETPRLIIHVDTTPANVHEERRTEAICAALAEKRLAPQDHLVDAAYIDAHHLEREAREHGMRLVGPPRKDPSWQARLEGAFDKSQFRIDWDRQEVICPEGKTSSNWKESTDKTRGSHVDVQFSAIDWGACPRRALCTKGTVQSLTLHPQAEHEALEEARTLLQDKDGRALYAKRPGVGAVFSQGVRAFGMRRSRYRGLRKTHLQQVATAAALDLVRLSQWMMDQRPEGTRRSAFERLAA